MPIPKNSDRGATAAAANAPAKQRGWPFPKGTSGNPGGRPAGSRPLALLRLDAIAEGVAEGLVQQLVADAQGGDRDAAMTLLSRVWPPRRGRPVYLPEIAKLDVAASFEAVQDALAAGRLSPEEAEAVGRLLAGRLQAVETADLAERIAALEAASGGAP